MNDQIDIIIDTVLKSPKYKNISRDLVANIGGREVATHRNTKEAIKATKTKLHQIGDAYFSPTIDYDQALHEIQHAAALNDPEAFRKVCRNLMGLHVSTNERLEIVDEFYTTALAGIRPIHVVLDIACGLNALTIPWMPFFDNNLEYHAYDIYTDLMSFIKEFMQVAGIQGSAEARDVTQALPERQADLALMLKAIPCLEQMDKTAGIRLLEGVHANHMLISFPVHSIGGHAKGMRKNYEARFRQLTQHKPWQIKRFEFSTELAFLVTKLEG